MTENIIYWAVANGKESLESIPKLLYNIKKIDYPFVGGEESGAEYGDISKMKTNWYRGYTYFHHYSALAYLSQKYKQDLLFFGMTLADTDIAPYLLENVIKAEKNYLKSLEK